MFKLKQNELNTKTFYLKDYYEPEECFKYNLIIKNHISKSSLSIDITDTNPWVSGITNYTELIMNDKVIFNDDYSYYINSFSDYTFIFNNEIQISGINYTFYYTDSISYTKSTKLNNNYVIAFNHLKGRIVIVNEDGDVLLTDDFSDNEVNNIEIISIDDVYMVVGYYDLVEQKSYIRKLKYEDGVYSRYNSFIYNLGESDNLRINKVSTTLFILTYHTERKGIIQMAKLSDDSSFSMGFPFIFNDDITLFSDSVYQDGNVVVIYYDVDDQLKVKNCRLYYDNDYIGIGLPKIIKDKYCYDLNIGVLDENYVYISYYDSENIKIYTSLLKISNDITIIDNEISVDDWNTDMSLTTIDDRKYILSYMDEDYNGVYREIDLSGGSEETIYCDYNQFEIDLSSVDLRQFVGHNDYEIKYNSELVEKGVCYIIPDTISYNI